MLIFADGYTDVDRLPLKPTWMAPHQEQVRGLKRTRKGSDYKSTRKGSERSRKGSEYKSEYTRKGSERSNKAVKRSEMAVRGRPCGCP